jgi:hypothetical protein
VAAAKVPLCIVGRVFLDARSECVGIALENAIYSRDSLRLLVASVAAVRAIAPFAKLADTEAVAIQFNALGLSAIAVHFGCAIGITCSR